MKKRYIIFSIPLLLLSLSACSEGDDIELNKEEKELINHTSEYDIQNKKIDTYYINDSNLEYVSLKGFIKSLDGYFKYDDFTFSKVPFSTIYSMEYSIKNVRYRAHFDFREDTISFNNPSIFSNINSTQSTNFSYGLKESLDPDSIEGGGEVTWNIGDYFDLYFKDDNLYIPFILANTILCSPNYFNVYYNGLDYHAYYDSMNLNNKIEETVINDSTHREANYNLIRFVMNNLYGLKEYKKIDDYTSILDNYKDALLSDDFDIYNKAYLDFFIDYLDDPHSTYYIDSKLNKVNYSSYEFKENSRIKNQKACKTELSNYKTSFNVNDKLEYEGNTAIIHFDSFDTGTKSEIFDSNNNVLPTAKDHDSYYFMKDCIQNIKNHGGIENIMLDLTLSPGGNLAAMLRVLGFMTNKDLELSQIDTINNLGATSKFKIDTNLNDNFDDNDAETGFKWGILASNYTYSAANLLVAIAKKLNVCKIYGEKSGGGMCAITPIVLADNSTIYISGTTALAIYQNNKYEFIEDGISVDKEIPRSNFYDKNLINNLMNN